VMRDETVRQRGAPDSSHMVWLGAKMVGGGPGGAARGGAPPRGAPARATNDQFGYGADPNGLACPIGAHVRRTNPRDDLKPYPTEQSRHMAEAHKILRRARVFGRPAFDPALLRGDDVSGNHDALVSLEDDGQARGIHFFCVNASIRSQFE